METEFNEIIFENANGDEPENLTDQFLSSGYLEEDTLMVDRFLDADKTIDLEKLELAITLTIEYLEKSVKIENPIYVFLGNMDSYLALRKLDAYKDLDRIIEESSFILGFCQAIADENKIDRDIIVRFKGNA